MFDLQQKGGALGIQVEKSLLITIQLVGFVFRFLGVFSLKIEGHETRLKSIFFQPR